MRADSYFSIGEQHIRSGKPCQDYALSKVVGGRAIAIVSDGCSSGGLVDVGARLIAHSASEGYFDLAGEGSIVEWVELDIQQLQYRLGLAVPDFLATLVYATIDPSGAQVMFYGDGAAVIRCTELTLIVLVRYKGNAPYYPAYRVNGGYEEYLSTYKDIPYPVELLTWRSDTGEVVTEGTTLEEAAAGILVTVDRTDLNCITVLTDGVCSFSSTDWVEVCRVLTNFKGTEGEYLKRRMIRGIQDYQKSGIRMLDDIAGASVYVGG
jgi:hypothetical protein